uniref:Uncharacterized protein n=1 Tax=viral metagenome TaxID=1070528 RepID=A0A6C0JUI8_9ZZZZ
MFLDVKTIILVTVGLISIGVMIYCILRDNKPAKNPNITQPPPDQQMTILDDQSESNYDTVDGAAGKSAATGGDESIYDSV